MTFSSYPDYKSSGYEWVGEIPSHWHIYRSKNIFSERNVKALESDEQLTASQKYGVIPQKLFSELEGQKVMQVILGRDILKKAEVNDFVISMRSFQGGLEFCSYSGAVSSAYVPLYANRKIDNRFFKHLFKSVSFISALQNTSNLVRDGQVLRYNNFVQLSLPFPSLNEQRTIGAFLDHETVRIDALIEEHQRLIELLKEKRQAMISHAVTKGLDPTVPMKDSGVEWLGEVPAHWGITNIKRVGSIRYGIGEPPQYYPEGMPLIRATNVHAGKLFSEGLVFVDPAEIPARRIVWLEPGDIVVVRSGAYTGDSAIIPDDYGQCIAGFDMVLRCHSAQPGFIQFALLSKYLKEGQLDLEKMRAAQPHLNAEELGACMLVLPAMEEQIKIVEFLQIRCSEFDILTTEAERAKSFLQERRSVLISAAVTGKIDVRGWQPSDSIQTPELAVAEAV